MISLFKDVGIPQTSIALLLFYGGLFFFSFGFLSFRRCFVAIMLLVVWELRPTGLLTITLLKD